MHLLSWIHKNCKFDQTDLDEEPDLWGHLKPSQGLEQLAPTMAQAAQQVYNSWTQDEEGLDEELGHGGICQDIAEAMSSVLSANGYDAATVSAQIGEQHVWVIAQTSDGVYEVDIPPSLYETGGGYTWKKIPDVVFDESYIHIGRLTPDPGEFEQYLGE
jgi:hypothetical protein